MVSGSLFIAWWDGYTLLDQTDVASGQDGSSEAVEEDSRRGRPTLTLGAARCRGGAGRPHLVVASPPVASGVFWSILDPSGDILLSWISFMVD